MIKTIKELNEMSVFFQSWNGKKSTIKNWYSEGASLHVTNRNAKQVAFKEENKNSHLTLNELNQLNTHEPRTLLAIIENGIEIKYQRTTVEIVGNITPKTLRLELLFTNIKTGMVTPLKVTHADMLKQLSNDTEDNDFSDVLQRLYQIFKD